MRRKLYMVKKKVMVTDLSQEDIGLFREWYSNFFFLQYLDKILKWWFCPTLSWSQSNSVRGWYSETVYVQWESNMAKHC